MGRAEVPECFLRAPPDSTVSGADNKYTIIIGVYAVGGGGEFCQRLSAVSHNTVSFESVSML